MKRRNGTKLIMIGITLFLAAFCLFMYNQIEAKKAAAFTESVMEKLLSAVSESNARRKEHPDEMKVVEIDGYGYIGYIEIPKLNRNLPVMSACDDRRLKVAPCRYAGSVYSNDLVIAAHNYRSHFGALKTLKIDDEVIFTDMDGNETHYLVQVVEQLTPFDIEKMTAGIYDLTLFTCTPGGRTRVTIRCAEKESPQQTEQS